MHRLVVLGAPQVLDPAGAPVRSLMQPRPLGLLAVLAAAGTRGVTRDKLAALLWGEAEQGPARRHLSDVLYLVHNELNSDAVTTAAKVLYLNHDAVATDLFEFRTALRAVDLEAAVAAYAGPFLEGFHLDDAPEFEHWMEGERARLFRECTEALDRLASAAEAKADWSAAARWWARAVEHDPYDTRLVVRRMHALAACGDRANALQAGDEHRRRLAADLQLDPDSALSDETERIRNGRNTSADGRARAAATGAGPEARAEAVPIGPPPAGLTRAGAPGRRPARQRWLMPAAAVALVAAGILGVGRLVAPRAEPHRPRTAIAVLPFRNLSSQGPYAYLAAGLHDELLTQLSKVGALTVIGRTSVGSYEGTTTPLGQIAQELGAGSVVEGSVQVVGNRLRVVVELLDPATQTHLWTERYDRTISDAFAVESEVARRIAAAVGGTLSGDELTTMTAAPTRSPDAYQLYLQGQEYWRRGGHDPRNAEAARQFLERAVALDPSFALAHAALSRVDEGAFYMYDPRPARAERALQEARTALRLAPDLAQSHDAMAGLLYRQRDWAGAMKELNAALRAAPNDAEAWVTICAVERRLGRWQDALAAADRATRLDPRNADLRWDLEAWTLRLLGRYPEAIAANRQALALAPELDTRADIGWAYARWKGNLDTLRAVWRGTRGPGRREEFLDMLLWERQPDTLLALLRAQAWTPEMQFRRPTSLYAAWAQLLRGDTAAARVAFDSALVLPDSFLRFRPDPNWGWQWHAARGQALAGLGRRAEASSEARWLEQSFMYRHDRLMGPTLAEDRAQILTRIGETDGALREIERLLAYPSDVTVYSLRFDPRWDPIRGDARFRALLVKYANPEAKTTSGSPEL